MKESTLYAPLPGPRHIRLLSLSLGGRDNAKIRCDVLCVSLDDAPMYDAISWEWGDPKNTEAIIVDRKPYDVPQNLAAALHELRQGDDQRFLWADAICVNLKDPIERADQVCLMRHIYKQASVVHVWLGPMLNTSDLKIFPMFEDLALGLSITNLYPKYSKLQVASPVALTVFTAENSASILLQRLCKFFELGWWDRLWVLQEVVLAQEAIVHWGESTIKLATILQAHDILTEHMRLGYHRTSRDFEHRALEDYLSLATVKLAAIRHFRSLQYATELMQSDFQKEKAYCMLIEAIVVCRSRLATDSRDKIYGLLGMLPTQIAQQIKPSYIVPEAEVFADVAHLILEVTHSFMLFNSIAVEDESWVPKWQHTAHCFGNFRARVNQHLLFSAGAGMEWQVSMATDGSLNTKGIRVDSIHLHSRNEAETIGATSVGMYVHKWALLLLQSISYLSDLAGSSRSTASPTREDLWQLSYLDGSTVLEAMSRALLNDCATLSENGTVCRAREQDRTDTRTSIEYILMQYVDIHLSWTKANLARLSSGYKDAILQTVGPNIQGKTSFTTSIGYIGLAPEDVIGNGMGDEVWVLAGGSHPVILRPVDARAGVYQARSEAYVQGIMDGEVGSGQCPVLPSNNDPEPAWRKFREGRRSWPLPSWTDIRIL